MPSLLLSGDASLTGLPQQEVMQGRQFLTFVLGKEIFAMPIDDIREVIQFCSLTEVPLMPDFLRGVINLRGAVVPVIELAVRFGRPSMLVSKRTCIIVMEIVQEAQTLLLGVMVDAVKAVLMIESDKVESPPSFGARIRADFIEGMINIEDKFVVVLDVKTVLSVDELATLIGMSTVKEIDARRDG